MISTNITERNHIHRRFVSLDELLKHKVNVERQSLAINHASIFLKNGQFPASFSLFSSFQHTVESKQILNINIFFPLTGFEPWISGIISDRSAN